jgi:hypothetical protein
MFGQIDLEITLAPAGALGLGTLPEACLFAAVTAANSEIGVAIPATAVLTAAYQRKEHQLN